MFVSFYTFLINLWWQNKTNGWNERNTTLGRNWITWNGLEEKMDETPDFYELWGKYCQSRLFLLIFEVTEYQWIHSITGSICSIWIQSSLPQSFWTEVELFRPRCYQVGPLYRPQWAVWNTMLMYLSYQVFLFNHNYYSIVDYLSKSRCRVYVRWTRSKNMYSPYRWFLSLYNTSNLKLRVRTVHY